MTDIITEKLKQHPDLVEGINERGGLEYLQKSTHNVIGDKFWESTGQNKFIEALTQAFKNVKKQEVIEQPIQNKEVNKPEDFTNHSGGAYGGDTFWDIIGRTFGFTNNKHYRDSENTSLSKQLRDKGVKAEVLSKEQMDKARIEVENLLGKKYPDTLQGNLQVRNYYQVVNSDGVFAIAKLEPSQDKSKPDNTTDINKSVKSYKFDRVSGGTNTAVQLGIKLNKPTYVWDITTEQWYKFNGTQFEKTETPILTKNFAGVGSRDIENYQVKNKETDKWESRKEYIGKEKEEKAKQAVRDVYQNTLNQFVKQPINKEIKEREYTPENVTSLKPNEVFVFGSNAEGVHGKGAALLAKQKFGAKQGQAEGLQGQSYAIITKKNWKVEKSSTLEEIGNDIMKFVSFASQHPEKKFYVTKIGSALAGYTLQEIKQVWKDVNTQWESEIFSDIPDNIILPKEYEIRNTDITPKKYGANQEQPIVRETKEENDKTKFC